MTKAAAALAGCAALTALGIQAKAEIIAATTFQNFLVTWDSADPTNILTGVAIQGLAQNETVLGLDMRPSTSQLYALGSFGRLYTIDLQSGQATRIGTNPFNPALNGSNFGTDFNPQTDQMRIVSNAKQNLRLNPGNATITADGNTRPLSAGEGTNTNSNVVHLAHTNNVPGATSTQLFAIDTGRDQLVRFTNGGNAGTWQNVGSLNFDATELGGFDVSGQSGTAFATMVNAGQSRSTFGTINLTSGTFTPIDEVGGGAIITGMTVIPAPGALALMGLGGLAIIRRRR
ncbi:MAG TPA: DUF4394 domain-containing protein [Phycisphaerales bacterium]|nr:DUF4394 domain-containing protein [Phycisphaerales bacterium]